MSAYHVARRCIQKLVKQECLKYASAPNEMLLAHVASGFLIFLYTDVFPNM